MKTPIDVIREALLQPIPCPNCSSMKTCRCMPQRAKRLEIRAGVIHGALVAAGLLATPQQAPAEAEMEDVARFLARESRFVRYYDPDDPSDEGWRQLLASPADVDLAAAKAKARTEGGDKETTEALGRAVRLLLDHIESRRAAEGEG